MRIHIYIYICIYIYTHRHMYTHIKQQRRPGAGDQGRRQGGLRPGGEGDLQGHRVL